MTQNATDAVKESRFFALTEWPDPKVLIGLDPRVIHAWNDLRAWSGAPIYPSKHPRAWARTTGSQSSRHFTDDNRLADAGDAFAVNWLTAFKRAISHPEINGIGLYPDTIRNDAQPGPMMHIDLRPSRDDTNWPLIWVRTEADGYIYEPDDERRVWAIIRDLAERESTSHDPQRP